LLLLWGECQVAVEELVTVCFGYFHLVTLWGKLLLPQTEGEIQWPSRPALCIGGGGGEEEEVWLPH